MEGEGRGKPETPVVVVEEEQVMLTFLLFCFNFILLFLFPKANIGFAGLKANEENGLVTHSQELNGNIVTHCINGRLVF